MTLEEYYSWAVSATASLDEFTANHRRYTELSKLYYNHISKDSRWILCGWRNMFVPVESTVETFQGYRVCKFDVIYDELHEQYFIPDLTPSAHVIYKDKLIRVADPLLDKSLWQAYIISNRFRLYSAEPLAFVEHSGAGFGEPKKYKAVKGKYIGLEIECCIDDGNAETPPIQKAFEKVLVAKDIKSHYPDFVIERDGSLERGVDEVSDYLHESCLEIVLPPYTVEELNAKLVNLVPLLKSHKIVASNIGDFFAVHATLNIESPDQAIKLLRTVYDKNLNTFWRKVSSRQNNLGFNKLSEKPYCQLIDIEGLSNNDLLAVSRENHYKAAYLRASGAIEIRIFQTKINLKYLQNIVELCSILWDFSVSSSSDWIDFLRSNASGCLLAYCDSVYAFKSDKFASITCV